MVWINTDFRFSSAYRPKPVGGWHTDDCNTWVGKTAAMIRLGVIDDPDKLLEAHQQMERFIIELQKMRETFEASKIDSEDASRRTLLHPESIVTDTGVTQDVLMPVPVPQSPEDDDAILDHRCTWYCKDVSSFKWYEHCDYLGELLGLMLRVPSRRHNHSTTGRSSIAKNCLMRRLRQHVLVLTYV